jgi:murein DD-endopeptidase MepM/ murein hydrolase activator NlpD
MAKPTNTPISSPLVSAFNNIVNINRSKSTMRSTQNSYNEFLRFMKVEVKNIEAIKLPEERQIKKLSNINVTSTFGSAGSLLSSLASGALDAAGLVGSFFGGGKDKSPKAGKPIPKGKGIRLGGVKAIGIANAVFAGLDFATGLAEGESVGKAASGAGGALAGSLLGGAIGQALIPVPGLGFVIGSMAGNFLGGYLGDRTYEAATGEGKVKEKVKAKLKQQEQKQKLEASLSQVTFPQVLDKFDSVVTEFQRAAERGLLGPTSGDYEGTEGEDMEAMEPDTPPLENNNQQTGETGDYSVSGGTLPSSKRGSPYGPRNGRKHYGVDYPVNVGTPISVIQPGTVAFSGLDSGGNLSVYIDHVDGSHTRYLHLSKTAVSKGQKIEPGTLIGYSGGAAGAYGSGNSTGPHLHYEYAPKGSGSVDPAQGNNDDKYFRFGGSIQVKPKVTSQSGVMGQSGRPTAVLAAGTNDYGNPAAAKMNVAKTIKELQSKGYNVVVVPPNESGQFAGVSKAVQEAASSSGASIEKGKYDPNDPLHLQMSEASRIKQKYGNAQIIGDSNAVRIAGGSMQNVSGQRVVGAGTDDIVRFAQGMGRVAPAAQPTSQVQSVPQQLVAPQQLEQYPDYNTPQNNVTIIPMMMGSSGGGSQQRPMVVSSGGGGGTTIMPPVPQSQLLNSYFNTMLLTNLSGT